MLTAEVKLTELCRVLRHGLKVPPAEIALLEDQLRAHTIVARPTSPFDLALRDPDDAWVLASALAGGAELLVTGDKDLLSVAERAPLPIVDPRGCWDRLRKAR
ncbi:MAG: putative toxin-antitoxin system toxin component, PIN family [Gemmatimonadetes bacterium]|nr:putative toxin-antitoxin system toxin component, PIN family [Gemmatimonadota bacterium]